MTYTQIFGAMTKDSYCEISEYFGIPTVEQLITNRHDRFLNRFRSQGNYIYIYSTLFIIEMIEKTIYKRKTKQAEASTSKHTAMTKLHAIHIYKTN